MLQLGITLALVSALGANLSFLYKFRGANETPAIDVRHPVRTGLGLWRSRSFALGMFVGLAAWLLHTAAISIAPMSVVQVVLAGGIVFVAILADRYFGIAVGRRQWAGLILTGVGLALLVVAMPGASSAHASFRVAGLAAFEGGLLALGLLLTLGGQHQRGASFRGPLLGAAAGILFGVCNIAVKATTGVLAAGGTVLTPWVLLAAAASVLAYYVSARSLQEGGAIEVIAITATGANVAGVVGGLTVFGDPMASGTVGVVLQSLAFAMVIVAAALLPAPRSATAPIGRPAGA